LGVVEQANAGAGDSLNAFANGTSLSAGKFKAFGCG
jgi:hypothetical protein